MPRDEGQPVLGGDRLPRSGGGQCGDVRRERLPGIDVDYRGEFDLADAVGQGHADRVTRLSALIEAVAAAYTSLIALSSPLLADPDVLNRLRTVIDQHSVSLHGIQAIVADRIREEQQAGRVRRDVDPGMVALIIAGTCHEIALEGHLMGQAHSHLKNAGPTVRSLATTLSTLLEQP
jgi:hypothetical protein